MMYASHGNRSPWKLLGALLLSTALTACSALGGAGPSTSAVKQAGTRSQDGSQIAVVELNERVAQQVTQFGRSRSFSEIFGEGAATGTVIGVGDILDVGIIEAPPTVLFGATGGDPRLAINPVTAQSAIVPQQVVGDDGSITIPFVGKVQAAGRTPAELQNEVVKRLAGKAHDPQAVVRIVQNDARNVTVIGEVGAARRAPLSARGERLLDMVAAAGGPKQPVNKTTIQLARGTQVSTMPLESIVRDPAQNIRLQPNDIVTVLFQPYSFIALGAVARNAEIPFEASGLSLAQALGRIGGLRDDRADIRGVFIFRLEDPAALDPSIARTRRAIDGKVPVVYRLNLSEASSIFVARNFAMRNEDIIYVSTAPGADLQRFLSTVSSAVFSAIALGNAVN
jgi:polysaccharide export outer membrane protein